jgi:uncharacterized protein YkwD
VRPGIRPALLALTTALLSATMLSATLLGATLVAPPGAAATISREAKLIHKINHARAVHGLSALRTKPSLMSYAGAHSAAMAARHELYHTTNFGVVCCWSAIGENIAYNSTVRRVHRALMGSPGHRANVLNPRMRRVGVGIVERGGELWVTEIFTRPS